MVAAVAKVAVSVVAFGKAAVQLEAGDVSFHVTPSPPPVHVPVEAPALRDNPNNNDKIIRRYLEVFIGFGGFNGLGDLRLLLRKWEMQQSNGRKCNVRDLLRFTNIFIPRRL